MKNFFTEKELELLKTLAYAVWCYIAPDLQGAVESPTPRDHVFELVTDASRLSTFASTEEEKNLAQRFYGLSPEEMNSFKEALFPSELYE